MIPETLDIASWNWAEWFFALWGAVFGALAVAGVVASFLNPGRRDDEPD